MDWKGLVRLVLSLALLTGLLLAVDLKPVTEALAGIDPMGLLWALVWLLAAYGVAAWRLHVLCSSVGVFIPVRTLASSYAMGLFFNCVLPTSVGGDAVRIFYLSRHGYDFRGLVVTGVVDRLLGFMTLGILSGIALMGVSVWFPQASNMSVFLGILLVVMTAAGGAMVPLFARSLQRWAEHRPDRRLSVNIEHYGHSLRTLRAAPGALSGALGLSVLAHVLVTLSYLVCGDMLISNFPWQGYFIAAPLVMLLQILPISLGGLGVRELSTVGVLMWLGVDEAQAVALSLAYLGVVWLSVLPGMAVAVYNGVRWQDLKSSELRNK